MTIVIRNERTWRCICTASYPLDQLYCRLVRRYDAVLLGFVFAEFQLSAEMLDYGLSFHDTPSQPLHPYQPASISYKAQSSLSLLTNGPSWDFIISHISIIWTCGYPVLGSIRMRENERYQTSYGRPCAAHCDSYMHNDYFTAAASIADGQGTHRLPFLDTNRTCSIPLSLDMSW
jgi:hypothetical protein